MMNACEKIIVCGTLLIGLLIISCDWEFEPGNSGNTFSYDLRGTWEMSDQNERYTGTLVIERNKITIIFSDKYSYLGNDNERPFKNISTGYAQDGYSEAGEVKGHGKIYIQYFGEWQEGIPYIYESTGYPDYVNLLKFTFGGKSHIMVKQR
jgi:hypothetical protein